MSKFSSREQRQHQRWQERQRKRQEERRKEPEAKVTTVRVTSPKSPPPMGRGNGRMNGKGNISSSGIFASSNHPFMLSEEDKAALVKRRQQEAEARQKKAEEILNQLNALPGMGHVKKQVEHIIALKKVAGKRQALGLKTEAQTLHMVFKGNPGTGKTTAARMIGKAFICMGMLKSKHAEPPFIEVVQTDIISSYVGRAEQNLKEKFEEARGGVIFFDEAYALNGPYEWNKNILAAMVSCVEDMRDEVLCIIAGYNDEIEEFLDANPGLRSRFPSSIDFPDYELEHLIDIAEMMLTERDYKIATSAVAMLMKRLEGERKHRSFGNARTVRNVIEEAIRRHSVRMGTIEEPTKDQLMTLIGADINTEVKIPKETAGKKAGKIDGKHVIMIEQKLIPQQKIDPWSTH